MIHGTCFSTAGNEHIFTFQRAPTPNCIDAEWDCSRRKNITSDLKAASHWFIQSSECQPEHTHRKLIAFPFVSRILVRAVVTSKNLIALHCVVMFPFSYFKVIEIAREKWMNKMEPTVKSIWISYACTENAVVDCFFRLQVRRAYWRFQLPNVITNKWNNVKLD